MLLFKIRWSRKQQQKSLYFSRFLKKVGKQNSAILVMRLQAKGKQWQRPKEELLLGVLKKQQKQCAQSTVLKVDSGKRGYRKENMEDLGQSKKNNGSNGILLNHKKE